jgi:hemoglobin
MRFFVSMNSEDILHPEDVKLLVDSFYGKVRQDTLLAPVFNSRIGDKWTEHLDKMYRFWETVLLQNHRYSGSPFLPHATLPIGEQHFTAWLKLFYETVDELFIGEKASEAKWRASKMAELFQLKLSHVQNSSFKLL